jgi:hypothetical protein
MAVKILPQEMDILCYWVRERENVRKRRTTDQPPPWTDDQLLREYRWCNVRRMDDRVSRWLLNWHRQHPEVGFQERVTAAVAGRLLNWPDTLATIPYPAPYREKKMTAALAARDLTGQKVFTGAYIVNGALGGPKILQVSQKILPHIWAKRREFPTNPTSMKDIWSLLYGMPGIGSFMAGQAVADLRHIHHELQWGDVHTWAPEGPGSIRGINRLLGRPLESRMPNADWLDAVRAAYAQARARLPITFRRLELMDFQSILCETDKYRRLTLAEGTVRSRYVWNKAPLP